MRKSKVLGKLRSGRAVLVVNSSVSSSPLVIELAGRASIECLWIDMEHRPFTQRDVAGMITAARLVDTDTVVRIRKGEGYTSFFRPLEDGATGIMVPHVKTGEEAQWVVRNAKYPPLGRRGTETVMPDADLSFTNPMDYINHANKETFVVIQIEDAEALDHLDDIAAVPGIDVLFIGPADLSLSLGIPFQFSDAEFLKAVERVKKAAEKHGTWWGTPASSVSAAAEYYGQGARFLAVGSDFQMLKTGFLTLQNEFDDVFSRLA